jgi:L-lactate dehydrogenase (cytochrome)
MLRYLMTTGMPTYAHYPAEFKTAITRAAIAEDVKIESAISWDDIAEIQKRWTGRIIIKGVLSVDDAIKVRALGIDGIVVSAHGGRNFDVAQAPVDVLPDIVKAVGDQMIVMADSGIRRGSDALKYLALGADAVMIGRLPLYGLAAGGEQGAQDILTMLIDEMQSNLVFAGARDIDAFRRAGIA